MNHNSPRSVLKQYFGYDQFKEGQEFLIESILKSRDVVGVMPTGAGKSICFQVPAMLFAGMTLVVSPLISLMKDQVTALTQAGIPSAYLNSSLQGNQYAKVLENAENGAYKILYIAPERLMNEEFLHFATQGNIAMLTIDEAHCISHWGQDFRPSYLKIMDFIEALPKRPVLSAFTATATEQVREDIVTSLGLVEPEVLVTGFDRKNLYFAVEKPKNKLAALYGYLKGQKDKMGIVFCSTRKVVEEVCASLQESGYASTRYHAGLSDAERRENQELFIFDKVQIMVATNAFGMGIDKSNVGFVVHYNMPKDVESYYQEAGRAGRDGEPADCLLFYSGQDVRTNMWLIDNGTDRKAEDLETELAAKERDRKRLKEMTFYCHTSACLRAYILQYFGEESPNFCGNCLNCNTLFDTQDITVEAQKILSCVVRAQERYGVKMIVDILRGSANERLMNLGLSKLSTYGVMADTKEPKLREIIQHLVLNNFLYTTDDQYPVLRLGSEANTVLVGRIPLEMKLSKERENPVGKEKKTAYSQHPIHGALMAKLKELRFALAQQQGVPAFIIFSDSALADMCLKLPSDKEEFLQVSGVGKVKMERYGTQFLQEIAAFTESAEGKKAALAPCGEIDDVSVSEHPITVSGLADSLNVHLLQKGMEKISGIKINRWLVEQGYLEVCFDQDEKGTKLPTEKGLAIGICVVAKKSKSGQEYNTPFYNKEAQELLSTLLLENFTKEEAVYEN